MTDVKVRPKHLNLFVIKQPIGAILSILHRVSGAGLFLMLPVLMALFDMSLRPERYGQFQYWSSHILFKLFEIGLAWAFFHHFCAGIRFLFLDLHIAIDKEGAKMTTFMVFGASILMTILFAWRVIL